MRVIHRDQVCAECGRQLWDTVHGRPMKGATAHHIHPKRYDGPDTDENCEAVCAHPCHDAVEARWIAAHPEIVGVKKPPKRYGRVV